jgi:hypothetical protein
MGCPGCEAEKKARLALGERVKRLETAVLELANGQNFVGTDPLAEEVTEAGTPRKDVKRETHTDVRPKGY